MDRKGHKIKLKFRICSEVNALKRQGNCVFDVPAPAAAKPGAGQRRRTQAHDGDGLRPSKFAHHATCLCVSQRASPRGKLARLAGSARNSANTFSYNARLSR